MKRTLTTEELKQLAWGDASVTSIGWVNENRDVRLSILLGDGRPATFDFSWVDNLRIDLTYSASENYAPMAFEVRFENEPEGRTRALMNFARNGIVEFEFQLAAVGGI